MISKEKCRPQTHFLPHDDFRAILSVPTATLASVATDLPMEITELARFQSGILSRRQVLAAGLSRGVFRSRLRRGSWQRLHPGVYAVFSGEPNREAMLWAAVAYAGPGAVLSHQTAAELAGLSDTASSLIHVTVPAVRRVTKRAGLALHVSSRAAAAVHPARMPPQTRVEETILDLWQAAASLDDAVGWVTRGVGRRLTTQERLRRAASARSRIRWRAQLNELLSPDAAGIHSVLEYRYVRHVERPHRLPASRRQAHARRDGKSQYRDLLYEAYATAIELDGQVAHPLESRWRDIHRDNAASATGITTMRYGWRDVTSTPCHVAAEIAGVLAAHGYTGARPCSADCPVGKSNEDARRTPGIRTKQSRSRPRANLGPTKGGPTKGRPTKRGPTKGGLTKGGLTKGGLTKGGPTKGGLANAGPGRDGPASSGPGAGQLADRQRAAAPRRPTQTKSSGRGGQAPSARRR